MEGAIVRKESWEGKNAKEIIFELVTNCDQFVYFLFIA